MAKYIAKRIGLAIVTCWLVATLTFFLMNLVPGGPFMAEKALTPQAQQAMMEKYRAGQTTAGTIYHLYGEGASRRPWPECKTERTYG